MGKAGYYRSCGELKFPAFFSSQNDVHAFSNFKHFDAVIHGNRQVIILSLIRYVSAFS